jgi:DNA-binding transcriptional LysR family regulator
MDIELRLLQCALTLAEHGNFARAAKAMHMSQPSLSRNIQELERRLGVELFTRNQRGVEPTSSGVVLLEQAAGVLARAQDLVREMELLRGLQKGELSIGAGIYPGPMFVDKAVGKLIRLHPAARVSLAYDHAGDLAPRLIKREFDLTVMYVQAREADPQLHVTRLKPHQIYFAVRTGHPLLGRRSTLTLADVSRFPVSTTSGVPATLIRRFRAAITKQSNSKAHRLKAVPSVGCESLTMINKIVTESDTVGLLPLNTMLHEVERGTMVALPLVEPWMLVSFSIARLQHRSLPPFGEKFVQLTIEADADLAEFEQKNAKILLTR